MIKKPQLFSMFFVLIMCIYHNGVEAKANKCDKYKKKYDNIQTKQRQPNNNKQSNKLKEQARKAFHQWRQCKQGKLK